MGNFHDIKGSNSLILHIAPLIFSRHSQLVPSTTKKIRKNSQKWRYDRSDEHTANLTHAQIARAGPGFKSILGGEGRSIRGGGGEGTTIPQSDILNILKITSAKEDFWGAKIS